jgi:hypothetical protein
MATQIVGRVRWTAEDRFYVGMALAMFAAVYLGFARTFFLRPWFPGVPAPTEPIFYVHGGFFTAWCVLLVLQPALVAIGRVDVHRSLGRLGAVIAVVMVGLGTFGALTAAHRATGFIGVPIPRLQFLVIPLSDVLLFATFVTLAIARRRDPQAHKRLMVLAGVNLLGAGIARWPFSFMSLGPPMFFAIQDLFILALAIWDFRSRGRLHPVTIWGGLAIILSQPIKLALSGTAAWLAFASWAVGLLG